MKYRVFIFMLSILMFSGCSSVGNINVCEALSKAIASEKFRTVFKEAINNPLVVYDATGKFQNCNLSGIKIMKPDFEIKINEHPNGAERKIVLYKYENTGAISHFYFLDTLVNTNLELGYNQAGELVVVNSGVF
jgi:hypothetical protein